MAEYNFLDLSPFDFELLAKEIAEKKYKRDFEAFDVGRDGGIDIRSKKNGTLYIGQCKHYAKSTFAQLKSSLKNEIVKVKKLNPSKYIVFTSLRLSPQNKDDLVKELAELKLKEEDIWGSAAINSFIQKNPEIEKHHIKLWLNSVGVLESVIFKEIEIRSTYFKDDILKKARFWVSNAYMEKANMHLEKKHFCIISGIPGIGKTTLAEMLCLNYIKGKFYPVKITSFDEFFKYVKNGEKQIFLYDDFLGETNFKDDKNFDDLKSILQHLNPQCKFIFTTREYIFNEAKKNEKFSELNLDKDLVSIGQYSDFEKAQILYNHLFYGKVSKDVCTYIVKNKKYWEIINHKNYSPRIIDFMCDGKHIDYKNDNSSFCENFVYNLENPDKIWDHAFKNFVKNEGKYILYSLFFLDNQTEVNALQKISYSWIKLQQSTLMESQYIKNFKTQLAELENTFIKIEAYEEKSYISFHNPSIMDYFGKQITNNSPEIMEFNSLHHIYWNQKEVVFNFLSAEDKRQIIKFLLSNLSCQRIPKYYENRNFTDLEKKAYYLCRIISDNKFDSLRKKYKKKILAELFKRNNLEIPLLHNLVFSENRLILCFSKKRKLKKIFYKTTQIPTLKLMLEINDKHKFIGSKKISDHFLKIVNQNQIKANIDDIPYYDLENYQESLIYLNKKGNNAFQFLLDEINSKLEDLYENMEDYIADAMYEERKCQELEDRCIDEINILFSSLSDK